MPTTTMDITITSDSSEATDALHRGITNFVDRKSDVASWVQQAITVDPDCAMAHATQGLLLQLARHKELRPMMIESQRNASNTAACSSKHEQMYIAALEASVDGDIIKAITYYESILANNPNDLFALALCQSELFWLGEMHWSENVSQRVASSWQPDTPGYPAFLAIRAFDLEETGQYKEAESCGRKCIEHEPGNVWGAHAVAHVLLMQKRFSEGGEWLDNLQNNWVEANQLKFHLWWHRCLFHLEQGENEAALEVYDHSVRNRLDPLVRAMPDLYIDLQNGASLLWRLENMGVDVGDRWLEMAELAVSRLDDMTSPFTSAHFAMILAAVNDIENAELLIKNMQELPSAGTTLATPYAQAAVPAARATLAHRQGNHQAVVAALFPARRLLPQMGASHAQQDIFMQMLFDSACKTGQFSTARIVLHDLEMMGFVDPHLRVGYRLAAELPNYN